jgi:hypothetical protein
MTVPEGVLNYRKAFGAAKFSYINDLPANQAQSLPNLYD